MRTLNSGLTFGIQCWMGILSAKFTHLLCITRVDFKSLMVGSFNLCQLFENQVKNVRKKGWHSLKYCVNMVIICVNMVILCINKRLTICIIDIILNILIVIYREKLIKMTRFLRKLKFCHILFIFPYFPLYIYLENIQNFVIFYVFFS